MFRGFLGVLLIEYFKRKSSKYSFSILVSLCNKQKRVEKSTPFYLDEIVLSPFQYHRQSLTAADTKGSQSAF
jgi:hypothetical protein